MRSCCSRSDQIGDDIVSDERIRRRRRASKTFDQVVIGSQKTRALFFFLLETRLAYTYESRENNYRWINFAVVSQVVDCPARTPGTVSATRAEVDDPQLVGCPMDISGSIITTSAEMDDPQLVGCPMDISGSIATTSAEMDDPQVVYCPMDISGSISTTLACIDDPQLVDCPMDISGNISTPSPQRMVWIM